MRPWRTILRLSLCLPAALPLAVAALVPDSQQSAPPLEPLLAALPATSSERVWVKVRSGISNEDLANRLAIQEERLAELNDVNEDHRYTSGDWLVIPSQSLRSAKQLASLDTTDLRRSPPWRGHRRCRSKRQWSALATRWSKLPSAMASASASC